MAQTVVVTPPYETFIDIDGQPLEAGYIYVGVSGLNAQSNPVSVYWDPELTIPAQQPIRTKAGHPIYAGSAAKFYTLGDYSIIIQNVRGSTVYTKASGNAPILYSPEGAVTVPNGGTTEVTLFEDTLTAVPGGELTYFDGIGITLPEMLALAGTRKVRIPSGTIDFSVADTAADIECGPNAFLNGRINFTGSASIKATHVRAAAISVDSDVTSFACERIYVDGSIYTLTNGLDGLEILQSTKTIDIGEIEAINCGGEVVFKGGVSVTGQQGELLRIGRLKATNCFTHGIQVGTIDQTDPTKYAFKKVEIGEADVVGCGGAYAADNKRHGIYITNALDTHFGSVRVWNQTNGNCLQVGKLTAGNSGRVRFDWVDLDQANPYSAASVIKGCISIADDAPIVSFGGGRVANWKEYGAQIYAGQLIDFGAIVWERPLDASGVPAIVVRAGSASSIGKIDASRCEFRGWYDTTRRGLSDAIRIGDSGAVTVDDISVSGAKFSNLQGKPINLYTGSTVNRIDMVSPKVYRCGGVVEIAGTLNAGVFSGIYGEALGAISTAWKMPVDAVAITCENNVLNSGGTTIRLNDMRWTRHMNITQFDTTYWIDTATGLAYVARDYDIEMPDASLIDGYAGKIYYSGAWKNFGAII